MLRKVLLFFVLIIVSVSAYSQHSISGQVRDIQTKKPISFATVIVLNDRDSAVSMSLADDRGFFTVQTGDGRIKFVLRYLGYRDDTVSMYVDGDRQIGIIYLQPSVHEIEGVTVKASKRKIDIDRQEVIVTKQMSGRAANVNELLNQVNGITYDRYNRQIAVDGHTNILILVNGLKKDLNYVKSLSPQRILKIQVIRDPGGRYGLEGYYAVINIILKDNYQGMDAYVVGSVLVDPDGLPSYRHIHQHDIANFIYTKGKVNFYVNQSFYNNKFLLDQVNVDRVYYNGYRLEKTVLPPGMLYHAQNHNFTTGLDYQVNPLNVISFEFNASIVPMGTYAEDNNSLVNAYMDSLLVASYEENNIHRQGSQTYSGTLFYKGSFSHLDVESDLHISKDISQDKSQIIQAGNYLVDNEVKNQTNALEYNLEGTYYHGPLSINAGGAYLSRSLQYQVLNGQGQLAGEQTYGESNDFRLRGYAYLSWKMNHTVSVKVGSAMERYFYKGPEQSYSKWIAQPLANLQLRLFKDMLVFTLKYRTQTRYPSASQLNPAVVVIDSGLAKMGNPDLRPSLTHRLSFEAQVLNGLLSIEPYYRFSDNYIAEVGRPRENMPYDLVFSYENVGKFAEQGLRLNLIIPFSKQIIWKNEANFYKSTILVDNQANQVKDWTGSSQLVYYNPRVVTAGFLYQNFLARRITAQGYESGGNDFIGMFAQKDFFNKKLTVTLFYVFPLNADGKWINYTIENYTQTEIGYQYDHVGLDVLKNIFNFEVQYRFSRGKVLKIKKPEQEQQQSRIKSIL